MATQSPFHLLESFFNLFQPNPSMGRSDGRPADAGLASALTPPAWALDEMRRRLVLLLNHVLMQESEATTRLARQKGKVVLVNWRFVDIKLVATPAGLLDVAAPESVADLTLSLTQESPIDIAAALLRGDKPTVRIEGDVQLAAEVNWLADHVRWDIEDDLARVIGDVPARTMGQAARRMKDAIAKFAAPRSPDTAGSASP